MCTGSSHSNFHFLSIKTHNRRSTTGTGQVLFGFASRNFWHFAWVLDLSSSHSTVPEVTKQCWTNLRAGTLPTLLSHFLSHSELATWNTDTFRLCMNVRSIVSDNFLPEHSRLKRSMVHCFGSESFCLSMTLFYLHHWSVQSQVNEVFTLMVIGWMAGWLVIFLYGFWFGLVWFWF